MLDGAAYGGRGHLQRAAVLTPTGGTKARLLGWEVSQEHHICETYYWDCGGSLVIAVPRLALGARAADDDVASQRVGSAVGIAPTGAGDGGAIRAAVGAIGVSWLLVEASTRGGGKLTRRSEHGREGLRQREGREWICQT